MGSFSGHLVPGSSFTLFGIWFAYCTFYRYFLCARSCTGRAGINTRTQYKSTSIYGCSCLPNKPVEGIVKIVATLLALSGEFATGFEDGIFVHYGNAQHMMMYFFFTLNGVIDVAMHFKMPLPPDADYMTAALAFFMESILFFTHLHERSLMDIKVHQFIASTAFMCGVATLLEASFKSKLMPALCRAFFCILQGTWFFQISFLLFSRFGEFFDENNHEDMMLVTALFTLHVVNALSVIFIIGALVHKKLKHVAPPIAYQYLNSFAYQETGSKVDPLQIQHMITAVSDEEEA